MKIFLMMVLVMSLTHCATVGPQKTAGQQELIVTQHVEQAYARAVRAALHVGMTITYDSPTGLVFTATRPTGEQVMVEVQRLALANLVTISGTPAHDVSDVARAYQALQ